ncbi:MAG: VWA domain-containing protein [Acidobacteriaceae bacterium]
MQSPDRGNRHTRWQFRSALCAVAFLCGVAAPLIPTQAHAQARPKTTTLPVTVFDKQGQVDQTLTKDDLTLTEDGQAQTIASLTHVASQPLTLGILVDTSGNQSSDLKQEVAASQKFLDQMMTSPADKAYVIQFDHEVNLLSDVTASKDTLHKALQQLNEPGFGFSDNGSSDPSQVRNNTLYDALYLAADNLMQKRPGRKIIVLISDGVDRGSKETLNSTMEALQRANVMVYSIYFKGPEPPKKRSRNANSPRQRTSWPGSGGGWPGSNGGGWPGGNGGGWPGGNTGNGPGGTNGGNNRGSQPPLETAHMDGQKILEKISNLTGASMYAMDRKTTVDQNYAGITQELNGQYILSYLPEKLSNTDYHRVILKAKSKDLTPQTRDGYYNR